MLTIFLVAALALQATPAPSPPPSPAPLPSAAPASPGPTLAVAPAAVNLHPSASATLTVANASGAITAQLDVPLATVNIDQAARTIAVTAETATGRATLTIADQTGASVQVPLRIALDAGSVPVSLAIRVTGQPDPAWLQSQVARAVARATQVQPGTSAQIAPITAPAAFATGTTAAIPVGVRIPGGADYFNVDVTANVTVQNINVAPFTPPLLFYDDDPEKIVGDGVLYRNQITNTSPARLYYYHQNAGDPRTLFVVVRALQTPATVQVIDASAGPNINVMSVGHAVSRDFLTAKPRNEGVVVDVSPGSPYLAERFDMRPLDGAAGSVGFQVLSGGAVEVAVVSAPSGASDAQIEAYAAAPQLPGDGHHRTGTFDIGSYGMQVLAYTAGGPDDSMQYGATTPPPVAGTTGRDFGDYGVLRTFTFDLANASLAPATAYLYERPMGGPVRSSFLIDGALVQLGCARVPERYQIGNAFTLPAQSRSKLVVQTMTDGGSNYPLEIGVTAAAPLPATPPMTAPDGCFPKPASATPAPSPSPSPAVRGFDAALMTAAPSVRHNE